MRRFCAAMIVAIACTTQAATIEGKAIKVADGDSITILDADHTKHRIRINGLDAPERTQPFGERSRQNMVRMVAGKQVTADCMAGYRLGRERRKGKRRRYGLCAQDGCGGGTLANKPQWQTPPKRGLWEL